VKAITLNLLAEERLAEEAKARDPLKTVVAIGAGLLMVTVLTGSVVYMSAGQRKAEAGGLKGRYDALVAAEASGHATEFKAMKSLADDVVAINRSRALLAPQMALLKDLIPDSVQLTRINFAVSIESKEPAGGGGGDEVDAAGKKEPAKPARVAKPKTVQRVTLQLDGRAVSNRPEIEVDDFLQTLRSSTNFMERVEQAVLRSIARAPGAADASGAAVPAAQFVIECRYKEQQ